MTPSSTRRSFRRAVTSAVLACAVVGVAACSNSQQSSDVHGTTPPVWTGTAGPQATPPPAENYIRQVDLKDPSGAVVGTLKITRNATWLAIVIDTHGLKPGFHGVHFHQVGKCEPNSMPPAGGAPGDFLSAGGHLQVGDANAKPASGDLTSLLVRQDGEGSLETATDSVTFDDLKGRALIIHAGPDNFGNIPNRYSQANGTPGPDAETMATGDAGGRVACGVIG